MKIPKTFIPEKNLDNKIENMLSEDYAEYRKSPISDVELSAKILIHIKYYLNYLTRAKKTDARKMIYISDRCKVSRYDHVRTVIESEIRKSHLRYKFLFDNIFDHYEKLDQSDIHILLGKYSSGDFPMLVIYTSNIITEDLLKKRSSVASFLDKAFVIKL